MRSDDHTALIREHYEPLLARHGDTHEVVGWLHEELQTVRFAIISNVGDLTDASILDVGCGVAHFAGWLAGRGFRGRYTGLDLMPEMVARARTAYPQHRFAVGNIVDLPESELAELRSDYVIANGIFHLADVDLIARTVARMYAACTKAVAFNSLSTWYGEPDPAGYFQADPAEILDLCRGITRNVILRHDYFPHDFTVYLLRE